MKRAAALLAFFPIIAFAQPPRVMLVMHGGAGALSMRDAARAINEAIPNAQLRTLAGQTHGVRPKVLAPVLGEFFEEGRMPRVRVPSGPHQAKL